MIFVYLTLINQQWCDSSTQSRIVLYFFHLIYCSLLLYSKQMINHQFITTFTSPSYHLEHSFQSMRAIWVFSVSLQMIGLSYQEAVLLPYYELLLLNEHVCFCMVTRQRQRSLVTNGFALMTCKVWNDSILINIQVIKYSLNYGRSLCYFLYFSQMCLSKLRLLFVVTPMPFSSSIFSSCFPVMKS